MTAPFSLKVEGVAHATGTGGTDPTELETAAQPVIHRPTGACNTNRIIPPSRLCAPAPLTVLGQFGDPDLEGLLWRVEAEFAAEGIGYLSVSVGCDDGECEVGGHRCGEYVGLRAEEVVDGLFVPLGAVVGVPALLLLFPPSLFMPH